MHHIPRRRSSRTRRPGRRLPAPSISRVVAAAGATLALGVLAPVAGSAAQESLPVTERTELGTGVEHVVIETDEFHADVAEVAPGAPYQLRVVLAGNRIGDRVERTSAMCRRVACLAGVNGDYTLGTTFPVGGVVQDGALLKSPSPFHHQLLVARDGSLSAEAAEMRAKLVASDLAEVPVDALNTERREDSIVLYTPAFGPRTGANRFGVEWPFRVVDPDGPLRIGQTAVVELGRPESGAGDAAIPDDGGVLSGNGLGAERLRELWQSMDDGDAGRRALLRIETEPDAFQSIGGTPILLRDGRRWFEDDGSNFTRGDHPRTVVGWNDEGRVWLVAVDGRQPGYSRGASLAEAADLLLRLGATEALNLDGGGSTTFTVRGEVVNRPSDRLVERDGDERVVQAPEAGDMVVGNVERPRANALVLVPAEGGEAVDPLVGGSLEIPETVDAVPTTGDPASIPGSNLPALVAATGRRPLDPIVIAFAAVALWCAALGVGWARAHRTRHPS